jgi:hypothetical protein
MEAQYRAYSYYRFDAPHQQEFGRVCDTSCRTLQAMNNTLYTPLISLLSQYSRQASAIVSD